MTSIWEMTRKGKAARISFVDERVLVVIDDVQIVIPNPSRRGSGRKKYWAWKLEREARELGRMKEHVYA